MHVVHYLEGFRIEDGGVVRAVLDLADATARAGHRVTIITRHDDDIPDDWKHGERDGIGIVKLDGNAGPLGLLGKAEKRVCNKFLQDASALHLHTPWCTQNLSLAKLAREAGVPYVLTIHGMLDDWSMSQSNRKKRVFLALFARKLLTNAGAVHCTAEAEKTQAQKWYPKGRSVVIPLIFDVQPYRELPPVELAHRAFPASNTDDPKLLFLSRIHEKKGLDHLIRACAELNRADRPFVLLVAGTAESPEYMHEMRRLAQTEGVAERTHFLGLAKDQEKLALFRAADITVLPTSQENFGFVIPESLACGTPVITTKGVDIWPELEANRVAVIADQRSSEVARAVADLLDRPDEARAMGDRGREWVLTHLDPDAVIARYNALYEEIAAETR